MHPLITRPLDRLIIRLAARAMPSPGRHEPHAKEAIALLEHPDFFCDFVQSPSDFVFIDSNVFHFRSQISSPWQNNNLVRGKLFCCADNWQQFPTVILLHGWNDELGYQFRLPFCAKLLNRRKVNAAVIELPYHLQRRPSGPNAITNFISEDLGRMVEATRQSIADVRTLVKWFMSQGCARVGLWGTSLGAWLGGLVVCHEPEINFAVLTTPVAKLERVIEQLEFCALVHRSFRNSNLSLNKLNLKSHRPLIPAANILIQEAEDDLFAEKEAIEEFWESWNRPEIWRLRHGHISILMSVPIMRRTVEWIAKSSARKN
jgi:hypothetical protein